MVLCVHSTLLLSVWSYSSDDRQYELLWVRVTAALVGALYHPPRPQYSANSLLDYVESCVAELTRYHPTSTIVLVGDYFYNFAIDLLNQFYPLCNTSHPVIQTLSRQLSRPCCVTRIASCGGGV